MKSTTLRTNKATAFTAFGARSVGILLGAALLAAGVLWNTPARAAGTSRAIYDVSWPNCQARPPASPSSIIVGVTGGLDFRPNPCLSQEAGWTRNLALYVNTGYPGVSYGKRLGRLPRSCRERDDSCWAYNYGYSATLFAINYANSRAVHSTLWWLDVETGNSWTGDPRTNVASLKGAVDAIRQNVFLAKVGLYSYPGQWQAITGGWQVDLPNWVATGGSSAGLAESSCKAGGFSGAPIWLTQYTKDLDINYPCSNSFARALRPD